MALLFSLFSSSSAASPRPLLVTSADGAEGFAVLTALVSARDPSSLVGCVDSAGSENSLALRALGVALRPADDLRGCFSGVSFALLAAPLTADRAARASELIAAAVAARDEEGLAAAFLVSVIGSTAAAAPPSVAEYGAMERELFQRWGDVPGAVALRTAFFQQNLLLWAGDAREHAALRLPLGPAACLAPLSSRDLASVLAALCAPAGLPPLGELPFLPAEGGAPAALELSGPAWLNGSQLSAVATATAGTPLGFASIPRAEAAGVLRRAGLDASEQRLLLDLLSAQSALPPAGGCEALQPSAGLPALLGRPGAPVGAFFLEQAAAFAARDAPTAGEGEAGEGHHHHHHPRTGWNSRVIAGYEAAPWQHGVVLLFALAPVGLVLAACSLARGRRGTLLHAMCFPDESAKSGVEPGLRLL